MVADLDPPPPVGLQNSIPGDETFLADVYLARDLDQRVDEARAVDHPYPPRRAGDYLCWSVSASAPLGRPGFHLAPCHPRRSLQPRSRPKALATPYESSC